jgi:hypothetical protein
MNAIEIGRPFALPVADIMLNLEFKFLAIPSRSSGCYLLGVIVIYILLYVLEEDEATKPYLTQCLDGVCVSRPILIEHIS